MDRKKAQAVLDAVNAKYAQWIQMSKEDFGQTDPNDYPQLVANWNGFTVPGRPAPFAIAWECNSPDDWALDWWNAQDKALGVFCEPIFSFVLGIYDEGGFEWGRVRRGSRFVHQMLTDADGKPLTCRITRVLHYNGGAVETVYYRVCSPHMEDRTLNKASAEYFSDHVVSFWED